jgi:aminopeptidase N
MASTQFEALDARRAFPCWDEPAQKATFDVSLTVGAKYTALSNMPESETRFHANGTKTLKFMTTPIMSTYLLAYVIGEFDMVQCVTNNGISIRVFVPLGDADKAYFSLDVAKRCLDFYDDYFQVPYPLPKLDMVAMPEFAAGAMENWGLVTYRQVDLMIDSSKATVSQLQRVASVVTHELAHQWFGNLVTMRWWDDLWLNEGFACWMQTFSADALFPQWKLWDQFCISDQSAALRLDALRSSHPIQVGPCYFSLVDK